MGERFGKGNVERIGGLWVLHLKGTSFERGLQHGTLMRYRVRDTVNFYRMLPETLLKRMVPEHSMKMRSLMRLKRYVVHRLSENRDPDALEETRGLAVGLGLSPEELGEASVLADVIQVAGALAERKRRVGPPVLPGFGCTSAIRETPGGLLYARNFDFWGAGYWDANPAVVFHEPDHGKAFCSIVSAGIPTGGITAINEDGLAVAVHQHGSRDSSSRGTPVTDIAHSVVRKASTVDEALEVAGGFRATGGWTIVVAGGSPPGAAVLEMSSEKQQARAMQDHVLVATNYFVDEELGSRELTANLSSTLGDHARFQRALGLLSPSRATTSRMAALLGDHYDVLAGRDRSVGFSISRITTLSSVVFNLAENKFWVSESTSPASRGGYVGFDLDAELGGRRSPVGRLEGGRPPGIHITSAQMRYLDAYKEYVFSGDLNRILVILGECADLDPDEPTFPLVEGIIRAKVGNLRGALSSIDRYLALETIEAKRPVGLLWRARVLDLMDRREESVKVYGELAGDSDNPRIITRHASRGRRRQFKESELAGAMIDFTDGDTFE